LSSFTLSSATHGIVVGLSALFQQKCLSTPCKPIADLSVVSPGPLFYVIFLRGVQDVVAADPIIVGLGCGWRWSNPEKGGDQRGFMAGHAALQRGST